MKPTLNHGGNEGEKQINFNQMTNQILHVAIGYYASQNEIKGHVRHSLNFLPPKLSVA